MYCSATFCKSCRLVLAASHAKCSDSPALESLMRPRATRHVCRRRRSSHAQWGQATVREFVGHSPQRMALIARGGPTEFHQGQVVLEHLDVNLDSTIFQSVTSALSRVLLRAKLGVKVYYDSSTATRIATEFAAVQHQLALPKTVAAQAPLLDFMERHCRFSTEHAEGSFLDHLRFCHDYSAVHFPEQSPRILLLHSILGVGTNIFPMSKDSIPALENLLTPSEALHVSAFPSVLRLITAGFLDALSGLGDKKLSDITQVRFHRVLDNKEWVLSGQEWWVHLNFHVMHWLDFLPSAAWGAQHKDPFFQMFVELLTFLRQQNKLMARVDFTLQSPGEWVAPAQPLTLGALLTRAGPKRVLRALASRAVRRYSQQCGHSLQCRVAFGHGDSFTFA